MISSFVDSRREATGEDVATVMQNLEKTIDRSMISGPPSVLYTFLISLSGLLIGMYAVDIAVDDNNVSWSDAFWFLFGTIFFSICLEVIRRKYFHHIKIYSRTRSEQRTSDLHSSLITSDDSENADNEVSSSDRESPIMRRSEVELNWRLTT